MKNEFIQIEGYHEETNLFGRPTGWYRFVMVYTPGGQDIILDWIRQHLCKTHHHKHSWFYDDHSNELRRRQNIYIKGKDQAMLFKLTWKNPGNPG